MKPRNLVALAFAAAVGLCAAAHAQTPPPPAPPPGAATPGSPPSDSAPPHPAPMRGAHAWGPQGRHGPGDRREPWDQKTGWGRRQADRATALHNILGIRPDQEAAFQAYALPSHPAPAGGPGGEGWGEPGGRRDGAGSASPMTAPERADAMLKRFDDHIARMRQRLAHRAAAVKTLYAALSPDQRRIFDALPQLRGHGGGEGGWGGHGGEGYPPRGAGEGE